MEKRKIINPEAEINWITDKIKDYFIRNGSEHTKAVIGISGGKDSTVAAALLVRALGPDRVIGVLLPQGNQADIDDSIEVCDLLGIQYYAIDINGACSAIYRAIDEGYDFDHTCATDSTVSTNTPARVRMTMLYAVAAMVGGRVINTGNASELYVGYTTKYGDLAGDFAILREYYVREIIEIGKALGLPERLICKKPSDGMSGLTDEYKFGFTYEDLDAYLLDKKSPDYDILRKIEERHKRNTHKECVRIPSIYPGTRRWNNEPENDYVGSFEF